MSVAAAAVVVVVDVVAVGVEATKETSLNDLRRSQTRYPGGDGGKVAWKVRWNDLIEHGRGVSGSVFSRIGSFDYT